MAELFECNIHALLSTQILLHIAQEDLRNRSSSSAAVQDVVTRLLSIVTLYHTLQCHRSGNITHRS